MDHTGKAQVLNVFDSRKQQNGDLLEKLMCSTVLLLEIYLISHLTHL